jgi:endonuclease-3
MDAKRAIKQLNELKRMGKKLRLAADGWNEDWKTLISTALSARTRDDVTIRVATALYKRYSSVAKLANANPREVAGIIKPVNFYKNKTKSIIACAKMLVKDYHGKVPHDFAELIKLPGVGRKTANVFLAEQGHATIGVDTHLDYIAHYLGWTHGKKQEDVEKDLEKLFPKRYWGEINWILVQFGQTYRSRKEKNKLLDEIKRI